MSAFPAARIYKIAQVAVWTQLTSSGASEDVLWSGAPHDQADGFIHLCTAEQLATVLSRFYKGSAPGSLLAVEIDTLAYANWLTARDGRLVFEAPVHPGGAPNTASENARLYPHAYGPLPVNDSRIVLRSVSVVENADGSFTAGNII
jgi:uncharacterized protein (DUF952 family)